MKYLIALALSVPALFAEAYGFKVVVATVHGEWLPMMPTIGYRSAVRVMLAVSLLTFICAVSYGFGKAVVGDE